MDVRAAGGVEPYGTESRGVCPAAVLENICDDYENVDQIILPSVARDGARCGLTIERSEVVDALAKLIAQGLAKAYLLSSREPFSVELAGMPPVDVVEEDFRTYFLATRKGIDFNRFG